VLNEFPGDTAPEYEEVKRRCAAVGVDAVVARPFTHGGEGCRDAAAATWALAKQDKARLNPLYETSEPFERKVEAVAQGVYGADGVDLQPRAVRDLAALEKAGLSRLPICMAKTHMSLSDDPSRRGRPRNFRITVREIQLAAGAGFLVPLAGDIVRMPGLPAVPLAEKLDLADSGEVIVG
jgi:formate--tetrahydrofolate ligase